MSVILIVGGMAQGKKKFAEDMFAGAEAVRWADGASAALEDFAQAPFGCHFHLLIRRLMEGDPALRAGKMWLSMAAKEKLAQALTRFLLERCRSRVLVTEEIGSGIIPLDPLERLYREQAGRVCCCLAAEADQVWRVVCGVGGRIK